MVVITEVHSPPAVFEAIETLSSVPSFEAVEVQDRRFYHARVCGPTTVYTPRLYKSCNRQKQHMKSPYCRSNSNSSVSSSSMTDSPASHRRMRPHSQDLFVDSRSYHSSCSSIASPRQESDEEREVASTLASMATTTTTTTMNTDSPSSCARPLSPFTVSSLLSSDKDQHISTEARDNDSNIATPTHTNVYGLVDDHFEAARLAAIRRGRRFSLPGSTQRHAQVLPEHSLSRHMSIEPSRYHRQQPYHRPLSPSQQKNWHNTLHLESVTALLEQNLIGAAKVGMQIPQVPVSHRELFASAFADFF